MLLLQLPDWFEEFHIRSVYMGCALIGGSVMTLQMVLLLFGGDIDADTDVDDIGDHTDGFGFISVRSLAAFMTFFGLTGLWGISEGWGAGPVVGVSLGSGLVMMLLVAWLMSLMMKLTSEGNINPQNAVGQAAKVYLKVPAEHSGKGKITISIQGRSHEFEAVTSGRELPTGSEVRVVKMTTPNTFEVEALA